MTLNKSEMIVLLEIAREALADEATFNKLASRLDLSDRTMIRLRKVFNSIELIDNEAGGCLCGHCFAEQKDCPKCEGEEHDEKKAEQTEATEP